MELRATLLRLRHRYSRSLSGWQVSRVLAATLVSVLITTLLAGFFTVRHERARLARHLEQVAQLAALPAGPILAGTDRAGAARLATTLVKEAGVDWVQLRRPDGTILAEAGRSAGEQGVSVVLFGGKMRVTRSFPGPLDMSDGILSVGLEARTVAGHGGGLLLTVLLATLPGTLLLGLLVVRHFTVRVARPLQALEQAIDGTLGEGGGPGVAAALPPVPQEHRDNEIGRITRRLTETVDSLFRARADLHRMARRDQLTGLPNRMSMTDTLNRAVATARTENAHLALLYLDLDRFKHINDSLGHGAGDKLLIAVGQRLLELAPSPDCVARMGGDEFMLLLDRYQDQAKVIRLAEDILSTLSRAFPIGSQIVHVSASIGISLWPRDGSDAEQLIRSADTAMYGAKAAGAGSWRFFSREMLERSLIWLRTEASLREALEQDQLEVFYQPKIVAATGRLYGMEALLRWRRHDRYVSPTEFISIAEDTGLIIPIGAWVLRTACAQAARWGRLQGPLQLAVNVSARQLSLPEFPDTVRQVLEETGLPPHQLTLEITESMLMDNIEGALDTLRTLRSIGCGIAVDDFGTGYSSLAYLRQLPITQLKIDRTFIKDLPNDSAIAETVLTLAARLRLQCVAEGVETEAQYNWLVSSGCALLQGFHISQPLPARSFEQAFLPGGTLRLVRSDRMVEAGGDR